MEEGMASAQVLRCRKLGVPETGQKEASVAVAE